MLNDVNLVGCVIEAKIDDGICYFKIEVTRNFKENDGDLKTDVFNCQAWRRAVDTVNLGPQIGDKVIINGSLLTDKNGVVYIDCYTMEKIGKK